MDPLVKVEVLGVPADCAEKETHHIVNNGTPLLGSGRFVWRLSPFLGCFGGMKSTFLSFFFFFEVSTRPGTRTSSLTCTCQSWRWFASSSKTTTPRRTTSLWPSTPSRSAACKWVSPSAGGGHKRASVFTLQKRASAGTEGPLQPPHKGFFVCAISPRFCAPTQDTDTCLCWTRMGTFCPQLASLCTSWSWTPSETPPSDDWLFYLLLNGCFSPFLLLLFLLLSRFS